MSLLYITVPYTPRKSRSNKLLKNYHLHYLANNINRKKESCRQVIFERFASSPDLRELALEGGETGILQQIVASYSYKFLHVNEGPLHALEVQIKVLWYSKIIT
jgi:hypothetical protein